MTGRGEVYRMLNRLCRQFTRRERIIWLIFTLVITVLLTLGFQITFTGQVWGTPEENYVNSFSIKTIFVFAGAFVAANFLTGLVWYINGRCQCGNRKIEITEKPGSGSKKIFLISFAVLCIAWLPYLLMCQPGAVYVDTFSSIYQAYNMDELGMYAMNNHHPILYTLLWRIFVVAGKLLKFDSYQTIEAFLIVQYIAMACILAWLFVWLSGHGLNRRVRRVLLAFVALFPLFPLYAISLWKDTTFCLVLLLFVVCIGDYALTKNKNVLSSGKYLLRLTILSILVCFLRNNGKYIVFFTLVLLGLLNIKKFLKLKRFWVMLLSVIAAVQIIQGPVYDRMGYNLDTAVESLGVPLQQMAYLVYYDYDLTEEELEYIDSICPVESIKEKYNPCIFDALKWYVPEFDGSVVENDMGTFLKYYCKILLKHPLGCFKAYMLETAGFWAPNIASNAGYAQTYVWFNTMEIEGHDFLEEQLGIPFSDFISGLPYISAAVFFFAMLYTAFVQILNRDYRKLWFLLPGFLSWLTIMLATPIACSLRYVYILVLMLPLEVYMICASERKSYCERKGIKSNG